MTLEDVLRVIVASRRGTLGGASLDLVRAVPVAVAGYQAGGGADLHQQSTASANSGSFFR